MSSLPERTKASLLSPSQSLPPPGFGPCLVSRFLAGSQARGSPSGQANSTGPLPTPPPPPSPVPEAGSVQLPAPSDSSRARGRRQPGRSFLSSSWGQQFLLSWEARGMPFPGRSGPGQTREQAVRIRNTSVGDCFKTRLFQASRRTKDVERSAQHHSVYELPAGALPSPARFPARRQPAHPLHPPCFTLRARSCRWEQRGGDGGRDGTWREEVVTGRRQQPRRCYLPEAGNVAPRPGGSQRARGWIHPT